MYESNRTTRHGTVPVTIEQPRNEEQPQETRQPLSDLLDKVLRTNDSDDHELNLRSAIEHAAQYGGTLDLSQTGDCLAEFSPGVMALLDEASPVPITSVILPSGLLSLPPCISELRRLACIAMDAPGGVMFDFRPLRDLIKIDLTNVPKLVRVELHTPIHCNVTATWPDGHQANNEQCEVLGDHVIHYTDVRDAQWVRQRLSKLLDIVIHTNGHSDEIVAIADVIRDAARNGGTLDLSKTGKVLLKLPQEVMLFLEEACNDLEKPLVTLILPPGIEWLPPSVFFLQHLYRVQADSPAGGDLNFTEFPALGKIELTHVPWNTRVRLDALKGCQVIATHPNDQRAKLKQSNSEREYVSYEIVPRVPNFNHAASFPNEIEIECRHIACNVICGWGQQDALPHLARSSYNPLSRVSSPARINETTPWEIDAIHKELCVRPVEAYYVSHKNWPQFLQAMRNDMASRGTARKYMLVMSLRHDTSVRLIADRPDKQTIVEHFDPNYTTISTEHAVPCEFTDLFADAEYFRVIYSAGEANDDDPNAPIAPFSRVTIIPNPLDLRSGVAKAAKNVKLTLQYIDFDEAATPALIAHLCQHGHTFFFPQLAQWIRSSPHLTRARCIALLRATVFVVNYTLMYRAMAEGNEGIVQGLGECVAAGFTRGLLASDDVFDLVAAKHGELGPLSIAASNGHPAAIKAYGKTMLMLFRAKALSETQIKRLMISKRGLYTASSSVKDAYISTLKMLRDKRALGKDEYKDVLDRVFG